MKNQLWLVLFCAISLFSVAGFSAPGDLLKLEKRTTISLDVITQQRKFIMPDAPGTPTNGVVYYKVTYETQDLQHKAVAATGLMIVPDVATGSYSLLSYQHGTIFDRASSPSVGGSEGPLMALLYGSIGYVVSAADYLGLGDSAGFHPYLHSDSEAWTAADLLRAVRIATAQLGIKLDSKLFLTGYSQGGHATMALHIHLQNDLATEFNVTASAPMAGPYDLSDTTWKQVLQNPSQHGTAEAAYLLKAMQLTYGLDTLMTDAIRPEFLAATLSLLDGVHDISAVVAGLPATPVDYLRPEFITEVLSDPQNPFIKILAKNDVYNWKPLAPVKLYQGGADNEVPYHNSEVAYGRMKELGADIELINVGSTLNHQTAAAPAFIQSSTWFEKVRAQ